MSNDGFDLRVEVRLKNNVLWHAIYDLAPSVAEFCRRSGLIHYQSTIGELINLKQSPVNYLGEWTGRAKRVSEAVGIGCDELFPMHLYEQIDQPLRVAEVRSREMLSQTLEELDKLPSSEPDPAEFDELPEIVDNVLHTLTRRERELIKMRYGIGGKQHTIPECAKEFKVSKSRVHQLIDKAIRKLGSGSRRQGLLKAIPELSED